MTDSTHVPDKLHAYTLQVRHMMCELISLDMEKVVSVEALEDVASQSGDSVVAEQIKSVQSENNPVADRAIVFWKTLYNWHQYIENNDLQIENITFKFVIISNRNVFAGIIPLSFHNANTDEEASVALKAAKDELWGTENELKAKVPSGYSSYLDKLFDEKNVVIVTKILKASQIEIHQSDYDDTFYKKFCSQPIPPEYARDLFIYMLGWVYEQVNCQTKLGLPAYIECKSFRNVLQSQMRKFNQNGILASVVTRPSENEAQEEVDRKDIYIKQLELIELGVSDKLQAANDFLRTSAEKTAWAERGIVVPQSFDEYYDNLVRMWTIQLRLMSLMSSSTDKKGVQKLYFKCQEAVRSAKVQGSETPGFFGSGALQSLANEPSNAPKIGWHPIYKDLLNGNGDTHE